MPSTDRRSNPRYPLTIPVRIHAFDNARDEQEEVLTQSSLCPRALWRVLFGVRRLDAAFLPAPSFVCAQSPLLL